MAALHRVVLIPAAGRSTRFKAAGIQTPKALLEFHWEYLHYRQTMVQHVVDRLDDVGDTGTSIYIGVPADETDAFFRRLPGWWHVIPIRESKGQADTVLQLAEVAVKPLFPGDESPQVIVANCDAGTTYPLGVFAQQAATFPGAALVFPGNGETAYSYATRFPLFRFVHEKLVASPWAMAGFYSFRHLRELIAACHKAKAEHEGLDRQHEFYLSSVFHHLPGQCLAIAMPREQLHVWGTPEDLARDRSCGMFDEDVMCALETL